VRVFVAEATTGAIGKQLVPRLASAGHEVHGMTRSEPKQAMLDELGAVPVVADALDPDQVAEAVARAKPEVIVHQLTAIGAIDLGHMDRDFAPTNRLRTEGIVLRYGAFYGPGTPLAPGGEQFELVRERRFPLVGDGGGVWLFIHIADAAEATVAAVERGGRGVYIIVDDDPAPVAEWLPALARILGAEQPMQAPRLAAGEVGAVLMTELRGASNAKAKRELGWRPRHPSWRQGFAT
jgi:nucleoside-diphosphate-sugar epimerase